jgi:coproporphyrinogen III oxidase
VNPSRESIETYYRSLQADLCERFASLDGEAAFGVDEWDRAEGGGGTTRVIAGGDVFEKGAINVSAVHGPIPAQLAEKIGAAGDQFFATGISMIFHPRNPFAPTMHANIRYFETESGQAWFGGGLDLTPYYLFDEDARHFHAVCQRVCTPHAVADYPAMKQACDDYFFLPHRGEARGIGGLFYDRHAVDLPGQFVFQQALGEALFDSYAPILERRRVTPFDEHHKRWHRTRRGRYVEFNLVWDRGTKFGLETGGRTESILVSMPPEVAWEYSSNPVRGTPEHELLELLTGAPRDWTQ